METKKLFAEIAKVARKTKTKAYAVGGVVRDALLGIAERKDIDVVVSGPSAQAGSGLAFAKAFDTAMKQAGSLVEFPDFDTARYVFPNGLEVEFAGARTERYDASSRKPVVTPATIETDLSRRDFTVNAMAQIIGARGVLGAIIDPFGGQADLARKILRTPLAPDETFFDDPLRMLRAARFAAQLGFSLDEAVRDALTRNAKRLSIISAERIQEELLKLLGTRQPSVGLWILYNTGLLTQFLPEICALSGVEDVYGHSHKDNLTHTFQVVDNVALYSDKPLLRFAGLVHDVAKPQTKKFVPGRGWTFDMHEHLGKKMAREICRRLRMSGDDSKYITELVRWHLQPIALMDEGITDSAVRRLMVSVGDLLSDLLILCRSDITTGNPYKKAKRLRNYDMLEQRIAEVRAKDEMRAVQAPVRGEEIMAECGLKPGPTVGKIKEAIEEAILEGEIPNEYGPAKAYFEKIKGEYLASAEAWEKAN